MQPGTHSGVSGAAGDDVEAGPRLHDDQVVHVLGKAVGLEIEAGLHRGRHLSPGKGPDEIAVVQGQFRLGGVFIRVHRHQAPEVVGEPLVARQGLGDGQHLHPLLVGLAMDDPGVGLQKGPGMFFVGEFDARLEEVAAFLRGKLPVVRVVLPGAALAGKRSPGRDRAQGPPFCPALFGSGFYLRHRAHSS